MTEAALAALEAARAARASGETKKAVTNPILRQKASDTRKSAIEAMCAHCVGCTEHSVEEGFRSTIRDCENYVCPLFGWRPYQGKKAEDGIDDE